MTTVQLASSQLKDVGVFQDLSPEEIQSLLEGATRSEVASGTAVFKEGDPVDGLYVIESGKVAVQKTTSTGQMHELATLDAKHIVGEMGLLVGNRPRTATVKAVEPSVIWHLPGARFRQLVEAGSPAISKLTLSVARVLAGRLDSLNKEVLRLVEGKGEKKKLAELAAFKDKLYKEWSF